MGFFMSIINLGILAHVDAGKTTLTEHILFSTGVINSLGKVDSGNTVTDTNFLEKRRGITIKSSPTSFTIGKVKFNLIDTPGHSDFITEVERNFNILDAAILVISAVEGIQAQTITIIQNLMAFNIPFIIFINKIDRIGANSRNVIADLLKIVDKDVVVEYQLLNEGFTNVSLEKKEFKQFNTEILNTLSKSSDYLVEKYLSNELTNNMIENELNYQASNGITIPIYFGVATKGLGINQLLEGMVKYLPLSNTHYPDHAQVSAYVFKIEADENKRKLVYFKVLKGVIKIKNEVNVYSNLTGNTKTVRINNLFTIGSTNLINVQQIETGDIGVIYEENLHLADFLGEVDNSLPQVNLTIPIIETVIEPIYLNQKYKLLQVLNIFKEENPLMEITNNSVQNNFTITLFGEVQKEVISDTLREVYNINVKFKDTNILYKEVPIGRGEYLIEKEHPENPFYATIGLSVEPTDQAGITYVVKTEWGALPLPFHNAIRETVYKTLQQGLFGWRVENILVTLTEVKYFSPMSTASDFRNLTPIVLMEALKLANTAIYEPINYFTLSINHRFSSNIISEIYKYEGEIINEKSDSNFTDISGYIPVRTTNILSSSYKNYTKGNGKFIFKPISYKKIKSHCKPAKKREGINPLNRKEYLLGIFKHLE